MQPGFKDTNEGWSIPVYVRLKGSEVGDENDLSGKVGVEKNVVVIGRGARGESVRAEADFVYERDATGTDLFERGFDDMLEGFHNGFNGCVLSFGATGSGKGRTLHGGESVSKDPGLIRVMSDVLFKMLEARMVDAERRLPGDKGAGRHVGAFYELVQGYSYKVESRFFEVYDEKITDLYNVNNTMLAVLDNPDTGTEVRGLSVREAGTDKELMASYAEGIRARATFTDDVGPVQDRAAMCFVVTLRQSLPKTQTADDQELVCDLLFVDLPGSEKLNLTREQLTQREGPDPSRGILAVAECVKTLATPERRDYAHYEASVITRVLQEALGGNCYTAAVLHMRDDDAANSATTAHFGQLLSSVHNYPVENNDKARGIIRKHRVRYIQLANENQMLKQQIELGAVGGGPGVQGEAEREGLRKRMHDLEGELLREREEHSKLGMERDRIEGRMRELRVALERAIDDKHDAQRDLLKSEEERLEVSKGLIEFHIEHVKKTEEAETTKFVLESRVIELEAELLALDIKRETHMAIQKDVDDLQTELITVRANYDEVASERATLREEVVGLRKQNVALNNALDRRDRDVVMKELREENKELSRTNDKLSQEFESRRIENERLKNDSLMLNRAIKDQRAEFELKLDELRKRVEDVSRQYAQGIREEGQEDLKAAVARIVKEMQVSFGAAERDVTRELDSVRSQNSQLKKRVRELYEAYRSMRYKIEDTPDGAPMPQILREDQIVPNLDAVSGSEQDKDEVQVMDELRARISSLESDKVLLPLLKPHQVIQELERENAKLRREFVTDTGTNVLEENAHLAKTIEEFSREDVSRLQMSSTIAALKRERDALKREASGVGSSAVAQMREEVSAFARTTAEGLEKERAKAQNRAALAEGQLRELQAYLEVVTTGYQREIVRLRNNNNNAPALSGGGGGFTPPDLPPSARTPPRSPPPSLQSQGGQGGQGEQGGGQGRVSPNAGRISPGGRISPRPPESSSSNTNE